MSWCTVDWVRLEGISDRKDGLASKDGPRRRAFQAEGAECKGLGQGRTWCSQGPERSPELPERQKGSRLCWAWEPFHI